MTDICRLCASLKTLDQLVTIEDPNLSLKLKLARCCQFELNDNDFLPQNVCNDCVLCLNNSWLFSEKVLQAQETLKRAFLIDFETNETLLKNEILANDQQQISQQDVVEGNHFSRRKKKQPTKMLYEEDDKSVDNKPAQRINELSFKIRSIIVSLHLKGYSNQQISDKLNIHENSVAEWIFTYQSHTSDLQQINSKLELIEQISEPQPAVVENLALENIVQNDPQVFKKETDIYEITAQLDYQSINPSHPSSATDLVYEPQFTDEENHTESESNELNDSDLCGLDECDKNENGTITESGLKKFQSDTWNDYPWDCCECGTRLSTVKELRSHCASNHETTMKYLCVDCSKVFNKYVTFINHVRVHHRPHLKYCCDTCSEYYWNLNALREHRSRHFDKERAYLCQTCGKGFRSSSTLQVHCRSHLPSEVKNKYKCDICFKKFGTKPNLSAHKRIHAGVRDYTCDQCGKSFVQKGNLDNHMLTHVPNKPFNCDLCGKLFKTQLRLLKHKTVHTGFKPHKCDVCGREFREKGTLREHIRIHTGAMPFTCEYCGKRFRFKGVLTTHRRQHTGERPYSCVECNHHFTNWPNYNKHMKRRHGINTSVTVRKPQTIPPSGMPAKAKLNHVVPTVHNFGYVQTSIGSDNGHIENTEILDTICDKEIIHEGEQEVEFATTVSGVQTVSVAEVHAADIIPHEITDNCQGAQITVLTHPTRTIHQVLNTPNHGHVTTQYSYLPPGSAMLGFYNLQGVDVDLLQSNNLQR